MIITNSTDLFHILANSSNFADVDSKNEQEILHNRSLYPFHSMVNSFKLSGDDLCLNTGHG